MNCKKCNKVMEEGDLFCTNCGTPVNGERAVYDEHTHQRRNDIEVFNKFKTYLKNPISFFNILNEGNMKKSGFIIGAILAVLAGLINILYVRSVIKKGITVLASSIKSTSVGSLMSMFSDVESIARNEQLAKLDYTALFTVGFVHLIIIMILTFIILELVNAIVIKEKLTHDEMLVISTTSYIPLVLGLAISVLATKISIAFGVFVVIGAYVLSFITLNSGINEYCYEDKDRCFIYMSFVITILTIIVSLMLSGLIDNLIKNLGL